jgi:hypothetical protein
MLVLPVSATDASCVFHLVHCFFTIILRFHHSSELHFESEIIRISDHPDWMEKQIVFR